MEGDEEYVFDGDTITVAAIVLDEPEEGYDYGLFAEIYPIYAEQPEDAETVEKTTCYSVKSSEIDSKWDEFDAYSDSIMIYTYQVLVPGAKRMKLEIDYELDPGAQLFIGEGGINPVILELAMLYGGDVFPPSIILGSHDGTISGSKEVYLDGSMASFMFYVQGPVAEDGVDFNIKLYPVYDEEHGDTVPVETSTVVRKAGNYGESVGHMMWGYYPSGENFGVPLFNERSVELFVDFNYDDFVGQAVDVYEALNSEIYG
jgi:hypothetical protein